MDRKVWLEVALNGAWSRRGQPGAPITVGELVAEGIACARAGAAIIHVHAYDPDTERQNDDPATYAAIIQGIRAHADAIVYPTIPVATPKGWKSRYGAIERLRVTRVAGVVRRRPRIGQFSRFENIQADRPGTVYVNSEAEVRQGLTLAGAHAFHLAYARHEPGFIGSAALRRQFRHAPRPPRPLHVFRRVRIRLPAGPLGPRGLCAHALSRGRSGRALDDRRAGGRYSCRRSCCSRDGRARRGRAGRCHAGRSSLTRSSRRRRCGRSRRRAPHPQPPQRCGRRLRRGGPEPPHLKDILPA